MNEYDFLILGGGSAGYNAASAACGLGLKVGIVDGAEELGGLCILRGCMPSKTLLESASRMRTLRRAGEFGLSTGQVGYCVDAIRARKEALVAEFADYRARQLASGRFDLHRGHARFVDSHTVEVSLREGGGTLRLRGRTILLATGSRVRKVEVPGLEETGYLTSDDVLRLESVPASLVILGGGATAVEFASFYEAFGVKVTLIQRGKQLLKEMDGDVGRSLEEALRQRGVEVFCHTRLISAARGAEGRKQVTFEHEGVHKTVEAEEILYTLGREPMVEGLNLEAAGVDLTRGRLAMRPTQQTSVDHLFAAGDVAGPYEIVHIAIQQAEIAARNAARLLRGEGQPLEQADYRLRLFVVFGTPEVAMVGMTEQELASAGLSYAVATYPFNDHGKSLVAGETDGFVKLLVSEESREIVGAAVVGPHASELIHELVVAIRFRATARDLLEIPHYHPTLSEIWTYPAEELA